MSAYPQREVRLWRAYGSMSLQSAVGLLRNHEFEYVGLEDHKDGHHDRQADRPLQDQAQEVSLLALEARGARSDGKVLRRDHLPQNATRGVGEAKHIYVSSQTFDDCAYSYNTPEL